LTYLIIYTIITAELKQSFFKGEADEVLTDDHGVVVNASYLPDGKCSAATVAGEASAVATVATDGRCGGASPHLPPHSSK